jgi:dTDP-4-amino-4,6-dideoxygalactose transaminase
MEKWNCYDERFRQFLPASGVSLPSIPYFAQHNGHIFYLLCSSLEQRNDLIATLKNRGIQAFFHYPPLHLSRYFLQHNKPKELPNAARFFEQVIRIPLYVGLSEKEQDYIINVIKSHLDNLQPLAS